MDTDNSALSPFVLSAEDRELLELLDKASMIMDIFRKGIEQGRRIEFKPEQLRVLVATCEDLELSATPGRVGEQS